MAQSSDRNRRRRATLVAATARLGSPSTRVPPNRQRKAAVHAVVTPPRSRSAARPPVRMAPAPRWRPRLVIVSSNAAPRLTPRRRAHLKLLPALAPSSGMAAWRATTMAVVDAELQSRRRTVQALLLASVAAAGLAALATSLGRLLS